MEPYSPRSNRSTNLESIKQRCLIIPYYILKYSLSKRKKVKKKILIPFLLRIWIKITKYDPQVLLKRKLLIKKTENE